MPNLIGQRLGNYCLIRYVGGGGFADVYLGEHLHLKILAAIKVLHARLSEKEMELFCQEARTIAHLAHPHIVRVLDFGVEEKMPFLVMEYAPNGTLRERHPTGERVPLPTIVSYVKQVAAALQHAHDNGIIHRDVKPANLLLGRQHEVVLSDFGTAMVAHSFRSGGPVETAGTILYMAPEQIQQSARRASDQYALGVMVYEWLCGGLPFRGTYFEVAAKHCQAAPASLREKQPGISVEVEQVVLKALAKDPEERFESVQAFATALERASRGNRSPSLRPLQVIAALTQLHPLPHNGKSVREEDNQAATSPERAQGLRRAGQQQSSSVPAVSHLSARDRENRLRLLKRVRKTWIEGVLEHSLYQAAMIALDLQERPDALANPGQLAVQETNLPPRALPSGTSIVEVYDQAEGGLLLLGEPGAGKTTLLLELAQTLLQRAEQEEDHRLPVVFNLSSWANKQLPLSEWLVEELHSKYQVPRKLGQAWISTDQVLPLLDGLDEVAEHARSACVEVINAYYQHRLEQGPTPLVVCCRSQEYLALSTRVSLRQAVSIQPLTDEQIHHYVQSAGGRLEALLQAWHTDPELYSLAHRPLMLSIFTLAYQGAGSQDLPTEGTREAQQRHYVGRILAYRGPSRHLSRERALRWLTFVAAQMQQRHQTAFYLEQLQPNWLADRRSRLLYRLSSGLLGALLGALGYGLVGALAGTPNGVLVGMLSGTLSGGLLVGLPRLYLKEVLAWSWRRAGWGIVSGLLIGLLGGLGNGLGYGLLGGLHYRPLFGLLGGLVSGLPGWLLSGLGYGLVVGLLSGLVLGLGYGLVNGLLGELPTNQLDERLRLRPNQGIWRSARNGLFFGSLVGLSFGLLVGLSFGLFFGLLGGLGSGLFFGLLVGLGSGLLGGLGAFLQHFTLRFWLWRTGALPWNMVAFLDETAERLLLRKVGGGYIFIHRLLLDYFAELKTTPPSSGKARRTHNLSRHTHE